MKEAAGVEVPVGLNLQFAEEAREDAITLPPFGQGIDVLDEATLEQGAGGGGPMGKRNLLNEPPPGSVSVKITGGVLLI